METSECGASADHFRKPIDDTDVDIAEVFANENRRQQNQIELIASENLVSRAVLDALGSQLTNKTVEGYPGNRFHGGAEYVDVVERLAIERARKLFGSRYANVQPHSGSQANQAVFFALLKPADTVLSLSLAAGGQVGLGEPEPDRLQCPFRAHGLAAIRTTAGRKSARAFQKGKRSGYEQCRLRGGPFAGRQFADVLRGAG